MCVCLCDTPLPFQHQTHIVKVTYQARWPFGKIRDTLLKKETPLIYHMRPVAMVISATEGQHGEVMQRGSRQTPKRCQVRLKIPPKHVHTHKMKRESEDARKRDREDGGRKKERGRG